MIKQIQLRGISRTPSDRMSEDGGLSESLNMYLDTAESAPAFVPEDVTEKLGLPADLEAERIFIHKTANYENYIAVQSDRVVAYTPGIEDKEPLMILELGEGEKVNDITSVGNTIILSSSLRTFYSLYREQEYVPLGNAVQFPKINFNTIDEGIFPIEYTTSRLYAASLGKEYETDDWAEFSQYPDSLWDSKFREAVAGSEWDDLFMDLEEWNDDCSEHGSHTKKGILKALEEAWKEILLKSYNDDKTPTYYIGTVCVRYAVELFDGSLLSSVPYIMSPTQHNPSVAITWEREGTRFWGSKATAGYYPEEGTMTRKISASFPKYSIKAVLQSTDFDVSLWQDIIRRINIYISFPSFYYINRKVSSMQARDSNSTTILDVDDFSSKTVKVAASAQVVLGDPFDESDLLESTANTFKIAEINIKGAPVPEETDDNIIVTDFQRLRKGIVLSVEKDPDLLANKNILTGDDMQHYPILSTSVSQYNNRVISVAPIREIAYDHTNMCSRGPVEFNPTGPTAISYEITYFLHGTSKTLSIKTGPYLSSNFLGIRSAIYPFQVFPDNRAYKMLVKATWDTEQGEVTRYQEFDMKQHPYLNCSYYYGGFFSELYELCQSMNFTPYNIELRDETMNKLFVSELDNPFYYPLESRYTFQSKVIGVATATTAISQGQFGQFPLYVFTEDGIWAMETAADGSFVSQKPLSREVCINPDSICSIDNAVVFVTDKAVMMIQGSQVMNISPYMNGKHYMPNDSALNLISSQEGFDTLIEPISDDDPFMSFMKDAKVAYDYTGQRLVFISPSNKGFQYVYKIDTKTWHKVAFSEFDLYAPLNSYPECLVLGYEGEIKFLWCIIDERPFHEITGVLLGEIEDTVWDVYDDVAEEIGFDGKMCEDFVRGKVGLPVYEPTIEKLKDRLQYVLEGYQMYYTLETRIKQLSKVYSLSTVLDASTTQDTAKGILITRPFDLGMPDVYKSITSIKIRGDFDKGNVKYILQGSDDGRTFYTLSSLRGKSWKMFRIFILADLEPTERISWIDIDFEPRYQNKLR